jgi:hypothetical protein
MVFDKNLSDTFKQGLKVKRETADVKRETQEVKLERGF